MATRTKTAGAKTGKSAGTKTKGSRRPVTDYQRNQRSRANANKSSYRAKAEGVAYEEGARTAGHEYRNRSSTTHKQRQEDTKTRGRATRNYLDTQAHTKRKAADVYSNVLNEHFRTQYYQTRLGASNRVEYDRQLQDTRTAGSKTRLRNTTNEQARRQVQSAVIGGLTSGHKGSTFGPITFVVVGGLVLILAYVAVTKPAGATNVITTFSNFLTHFASEKPLFTSTTTSPGGNTNPGSPKGTTVPGNGSVGTNPFGVSKYGPSSA